MEGYLPWSWLWLAACLVLWWVVRQSGWNLVVVVRDGTVDVRGRALAGRAGAVGDFFRQDLPEVRRARVKGSWDGRRLRLTFDGRLTPAQRQRIRNFLLTVL